MESFVDAFLNAFNSFFGWMDRFTFLGISVLDLIYFNFFIALIFAFVLEPIIGGPRDGSLMQVKSEANARRERKNAERQNRAKKSSSRKGK